LRAFCPMRYIDDVFLGLMRSTTTIVLQVRRVRNFPLELTSSGPRVRRDAVTVVRETFFGELDNLTTKIITLLEFFNFVSEVSRLQYE
jgi:hypothetical protein